VLQVPELQAPVPQLPVLHASVPNPVLHPVDATNKHANDPIHNQRFITEVLSGPNFNREFHITACSARVHVSPTTAHLLIFPLIFRPHISPGAHNRTHPARQNQTVPERLPQIAQFDD
jgi:hypothetical protein